MIDVRTFHLLFSSSFGQLMRLNLLRPFSCVMMRGSLFPPLMRSDMSRQLWLLCVCSISLNGCIFFQDGESATSSTDDMSERSPDQGSPVSPDMATLPDDQGSTTPDQGSTGSDLGPVEEDMMTTILDMAPDMAPDIDAAADMAPPSQITDVRAIVSERVNVSTMEVCVRAQCPGGTTLLGGGGEWSPSINLTQDSPQTEGASEASWVVCGTAGALEGTMRAVAVCGDVPHDMETLVETLSLAAEQQECLQVSCPEEMSVVSGGFDNVRRNVNVLESRPFKGVRRQGWKVCANNRARADVKLNVYAHCIGKEANVQIETTIGEHPGGLDAAMSEACVAASCSRAGHLAVGGGSNMPTSINRTHSRPQNQGSAWSVCGSALLMTRGWEVDALCIPASTPEP